MASSPSPAPLARSRIVAWVLAYWLIVAALELAQDVLQLDLRLGSGPFLRSGLGNLLAVGVWAAVSAVVFLLTRNRRSFGLRDAAQVMVTAAALAVLVQGAQDLARCHGFPDGCGSADYRWDLALVSLPNTFAITVNLFAVGWTIRSAAISREHRERTATARTELLRAQTRALDRQLRPHFLFNTLQAAATLVHRDAPAARRMLLGLRSLLRHSLETGAAAEVPLEEELDTLRLYLEIESWRFGDRLETAFQVEPPAQAARIPPLLLQPLVENAVHHAVAIRGRGRIEIGARVDPVLRQLHVTVTDTGPGAPPGPRGAPSGIGLQNVRTRLQVLYGGEWHLDFRVSQDGTGVAWMVLPLRTGGE